MPSICPFPSDKNCWPNNISSTEVKEWMMFTRSRQSIILRAFEIDSNYALNKETWQNIRGSSWSPTDSYKTCCVYSLKNLRHVEMQTKYFAKQHAILNYQSRERFVFPFYPFREQKKSFKSVHACVSQSPSKCSKA